MEILIVGCFHFEESALDIFSPESQAQLQALAGGLAAFAPDAVAVEAAAHQQAVIDEAYRRFSLEDLESPDKMRRDTLGTIHVFGEDKPMNYRNEIVQLGFRLGKLLELPRVFAIDDDSEMDGAPFEAPIPAAQEAMDAFAAFAGRAPAGLTALLRFCNQPQWSQLNHSIYLRANETGSSEDYSGASSISQWYQRNLKIFSNIQRLAQGRKRVLALYGAGHLHLLRQFIREDGRFRLIELEDAAPQGGAIS